MSLRIIGIGLVPQDLTLRGIEAAKACDRIFLDGYTSVQVEEGLGAVIGRTVETLDRGAIESDMLVDMAASEDICLLVPGDGLTATTHLSLLMDCGEKGIDAGFIPGVSVATVVPGMLGLQWYKFGRATTVPFPAEGYRPDSPHGVVAANIADRLHTLVLLDIEVGRMMTASEALDYLVDIDREKEANAVGPETVVAAVARAGASDQTAVSGLLEAVSAADIGPPPHTVVIPGEMHFMEEDSLKRFWVE